MMTTAMFGGSADVGVPLLLLLLPFAVLLMVLFLLRLFVFSASTAGIEAPTMGKAMVTLACGSVYAIIVVGIFSLLPVIGTVLGLLIDFFTRPVFTVVFFNTTYSRGLVAQILFLLLGALIAGAVVIAVIVGGGVGMSLH